MWPSARSLLGWVLVALVAGLAASCQADVGPRAGSETHFLSRCTGQCSGGFDCVCGVCTTPCAEDAGCSSALAMCLPAEASCGASSGGYCDVACGGDADCAGLGPLYACEGGRCRDSATGSTTGELSCESSEIPSDQLVVLGDSLIELSGMTGFLEELARADGALGPEQSYRDQASATTSFLAQNAFSISSQYQAASEQGPVRGIVMNGGATDMMQAGCSDPPTGDCSLIVNAMAGAQAMLDKMANDGVEALIYAFYANPVNNPGLEARLDLLRPLMQTACEESRVPCHFIDLRAAFEGHYDEYVGPDGIVFSEQGARAAAQQIYGVMRDSCIAR